MEAIRAFFANIPLDLGIAVLIFIALLAFNYTIGKHRSVTALAALYISGAVMMLAPAIGFLDSVIPVDRRWLPVMVFGVVALLVYAILSRSNFFEPNVVPTGWELALFALLQTIVILVIVVALLPASITEGLSVNFIRLFVEPVMRSIMIAAPLAVLAVLRGR